MNQLSPPKNSWQMKLFPILTILGWLFIGLAFVIGAFVLAPAAANYFGAHAKAARDAAEAGSALLGQLQVLASTPRWLEPLAFLGVASFMVGIALEFSTIPAILKNRGKVMSKVFPLIAKSN